MNIPPFTPPRFNVLFVIGNYQDDFSIHGVYSSETDFEKAVEEAENCNYLSYVVSKPVVMTIDQIKDRLVAERLRGINLTEAAEAFTNAAFPKPGEEA